VTGPGSKWTLSNVIRVGNSSSFNQLTVANGGNVSTPYLYIAGNSPGTNNTAWITDADSSVNVGFDMLVGFNGSYSQLTVSNSGIFTAGNSLVLGYNSLNNVATVSGGSIFVTNTFRNALTEVRGGTFNLNSGLLKSDSLTLTNGSQSQFNFNGGTLQTINSTNSRFFSVGDGTSSATLELLGGTNGFAGGLNINSNALLKGNGTIIGNVTNTGTLSPGTSVGQFTMKGSLIAGSGSTNMFELNKSATTNDNVIGLASVTYGGTLLLANLGGTLTNGDTFTLFTATNYAGAFDSITAPALAPGLKWSFDRLLIDGVVRVVANGPPVINSFNLINSTNLVFGITNGSPNDTVYLLTTTNLAEPATNWVRVLTNQFDSLGNLNITNAITTGETSRFYRLQVP
jgi:T5SS/PEP-CTERM-associated repeat protein